jgi:hypothetical protein
MGRRASDSKHAAGREGVAGKGHGRECGRQGDGEGRWQRD